MSRLRRDPFRVRRSATAIAVLLVACTSAATSSPSPSSHIEPTFSSVPGAPRPNVLVVVTDDQSFGSLPARPPAMPWLQARLRSDPHWLRFDNAVVSTPICCPSRATILTGRYARHTDVLGNQDGARLDEADTLATWLASAGYTNALIGKYLNLYPWDRGPYVPSGWDRWLAKRNVNEGTTYYGYDVVDQTTPLFIGHRPRDYSTTFLARAALEFVRGAPIDDPWFLYFAPSAPHKPWTPAPGDGRAFADLRTPAPSLAALNRVAGAADWVRALPRVDTTRRAELQRRRAGERRALLAVDGALRQLIGQIRRRGELHRTVIFFLSDNGYAFGEHRWEGKRCPYEECIRVPFAVRTPWTTPDDRVLDTLVSNIDVAPTIADLAGVRPAARVDGVSLARMLRGGAPPERRGVFLDWPGDGDVPPWVGVRTERAVFIRSGDGTEELYRLDRDPHELRNLVGERSAATLQASAERMLERFVRSLLQGAVPVAAATSGVPSGGESGG
jgi:N-acetylglucosamine-6-sulfatase